MAIRDHLDGLWSDEDFAEWYPRDGKPGLSPARLATVSVFQFLLELSDRQAAEAVRCRIDFTYALGMELDDPGFHHSVLTDFRDRLAEDDRVGKLLDLVLERIKAAGLVTEPGRQRDRLHTHIERRPGPDAPWTGHRGHACCPGRNRTSGTTGNWSGWSQKSGARATGGPPGSARTRPGRRPASRTPATTSRQDDHVLPPQQGHRRLVHGHGCGGAHAQQLLQPRWAKRPVAVRPGLRDPERAGAR
ncbi:transposase [Streptomyces sp. NPDC049577]|uniref:transposase n=1 Tax=Streptomyces sp. NPDC049577 TaxID=3155153 RepID=UPI0034318C71